VEIEGRLERNGTRVISEKERCGDEVLLVITQTLERTLLLYGRQVGCNER